MLAGMLAALVVVVCLFALVVYDRVRRSLREEFDESLADTARALAAAVEYDKATIEIELDLDKLPRFRKGPSPAYFQFCGLDGHVLQRSPSLGRGDLPAFSGEADNPAFHSLKLPDGRAGRAVALQFVPRQDVEQPGQHEAAGRIAVVVADETASVDRRLALLRWILLGAGAATLAAAVFVTLFVVRGSLRPVDALARDIAAVRPPPVSGRVCVEALPKELTPVGEKLNDLLVRLEEAFRRERGFTTNVAHELRTPLAGLRSVLDVCLSRPREGEDYREALAECLEIVRRMDSMVGALLTLHRVDSGQNALQQEVLNVREEAEAAWAPLAQVAADKKVSFENRTAPGLACLGNGQCLSTALGCLLDNGVEYADEGGWVRIEAAEGQGSVTITVANSGCRLTREQVACVFESFWRGDAARTDTGRHYGLGLSLVERCAKAMGGSASAELRGGGVFAVRLCVPAASGGRPARGAGGKAAP